MKKLEEEAQTKKEEKNKKGNKKCDKHLMEIEKLQLENAALNDKVLRILAENHNMQNRFDKDLENKFKYEGEEFAKKIISIVDDFERAINLDDDNLDDEVSKFLSGMKMIYVKLLNILSDQGIKEIDCLHKEFDPNTMEALMTESVVEEEPNVVVDVLQKGYMYKDKVLRHACVKVNI